MKNFHLVVDGEFHHDYKSETIYISPIGYAHWFDADGTMPDRLIAHGSPATRDGYLRSLEQ